ncbi:MAG: peptidyl-prolyl cis-trans isomerase [Planctomycetes bacterium]|nr:peptidyl-prolyl cis-trans isomerase [Planctomycetota bacterium]
MKCALLTLVCLLSAPVLAAESESQRDAAAGAAAAAVEQMPTAPEERDNPAQQGDLAVARVGDQTIYLSDLFAWTRRNPNYLKDFGTQRGRNVVLHQLIKSTLLAGAASEYFADDPELADKTLSEKVTRYKIRFLTPKSEPSDEDLRSHYAKHIDEFGIPPMVRIRELFVVKAPDESVEATRERAAQLEQKLQQGKPFEDLAAQYAPDYPSQLAGGDRGFLSILERPQLGELTAQMSPGEISKPVELTDGFSIVQFVDRRAAVPADFDQIRKAVAGSLMAERQSEMLAAFYKKEASRRGVTILESTFDDAWRESGTTAESGQSTPTN